MLDKHCFQTMLVYQFLIATADSINSKIIRFLYIKFIVNIMVSERFSIFLRLIEENLRLHFIILLPKLSKRGFLLAKTYEIFKFYGKNHADLDQKSKFSKK
jgi:hypothetical protein